MQVSSMVDCIVLWMQRYPILSFSRRIGLAIEILFDVTWSLFHYMMESIL